MAIEMSEKRCSTRGCTNRLATFNRSGVCGYCSNGTSPAMRALRTKPKAAERPVYVAPPTPAEASVPVLPAVADLPDDYLCACVTEAQRRAAAVVEEASQRAARLLAALSQPATPEIPVMVEPVVNGALAHAQ